MKKKICIFIIFCIFALCIDVKAKAIKKEGSNFGASLWNINEGLKADILELSDNDQLCFYKTYIDDDKMDDDYVVILFTVDGITNKYTPIDVTGKFATALYGRQNAEDFDVVVEATNFEKVNGKFGGNKWYQAKTSVNYYVYNGSLQGNSLCSQFMIVYRDTVNETFLLDASQKSSEMYNAKYTDMRSTTNYEYNDDNKLSEQDVYNTLNGVERIQEEDKVGCDVNMNTYGLSTGRFNLDQHKTYGWYLTNGHQNICFAEADSYNSFTPIIPFEANNTKFKEEFKGHCNDYCLTSKLDNNEPFCDAYYIKKDENNKCENVSEDISTSVHDAGSKITSYVEYNNSNAVSINVYYDNDQVTVDMGSQKLTVNNMDNYKSIFQNKEEDKYPKYLFLVGSTYSFGDKRPDNFDKIYINVNSLNKIGLGEEQEYQTCEELFGNGETSDFLDFIKNEVLKFIWIGVAILLILLTSFDFAKVVFSDDKDGMKKAFDNFKKRAVAAILIFLTPTIIILIINLIAPDQESIQDCVKTIRNMSQTSEIINTNLTK